MEFECDMMISFSFQKPAHQNLAPEYNFTGRTPRCLCVLGGGGGGEGKSWVTYY